jgi:hypothetical protein
MLVLGIAALKVHSHSRPIEAHTGALCAAHCRRSFTASHVRIRDGTSGPVTAHGKVKLVRKVSYRVTRAIRDEETGSSPRLPSRVHAETRFARLLNDIDYWRRRLGAFTAFPEESTGQSSSANFTPESVVNRYTTAASLSSFAQ